MALAVAILTVLLLGMETRGAWADMREITLSGIDGDLIHKIAADVLVVAYDRIDVPVTFRWVPSKRALSEADRGRTDGDIARIAGTEKTYGNLVQLETPIVSFTAATFTIYLEEEIRSWDDLRAYRIGVRYGVRYAANATEGMKRIFGKDIQELFRHLDYGHVDIVVVAEIPGLVTAAAEFPGAGIHRIGRPLHVVPLFHYLNVKNADLVPQLNVILRDMAEQGEIEEIRQRALDRLIAAY